MIHLHIDAHVATATMDSPPVNAINPAWIERFNAILEVVEQDERISVLRIRSASKVFCAGADLSLMRELLQSDQGRDQMIGVVREIQRVLFRLEAIGAVSIAEIGGAALGGGLEIALACDLRLAATSAEIGLPESNLGLLPGAGGTQRLTRICGEAVARRLILGAEVLDGAQAAALGVVHWAVARDELDARGAELAKRIGAATRPALAACKRCIEASVRSTRDGYEMELRETRCLHDLPETQERVRRMLRREPGKR